MARRQPSEVIAEGSAENGKAGEGLAIVEDLATAEVGLVTGTVKAAGEGLAAVSEGLAAVIVGASGCVTDVMSQVIFPGIVETAMAVVMVIGEVTALATGVVRLAISPETAATMMQAAGMVSVAGSVVLVEVMVTVMDGELLVDMVTAGAVIVNAAAVMVTAAAVMVTAAAVMVTAAWIDREKRDLPTCA